MTPTEWLIYANQNATRSKPLAPQLVDALSFLPSMGLTAKVVSGGQAALGSGGPRTGSTRHDNGLAADVDFYQGGRRLNWNNPQDLPILQDVIRQARARGVTGIGAGDDYMGPGRFHIGFGTPSVWGAGGRSENAPDWLREAYGAAAPSGGMQLSASTKGRSGMVGLLDMQEEPQTFGDRLREGWRSGSLMDNLALAFNSMRLNPDQNLAQIVQNRQEQRTSQKTTNRTAQWLMSQGREDLAQALLTGAVDAKSAAALALTPAKDDRTAMIQNYEYWLRQGKTPEEAQALARAGSGGTVIDMSGGGKFEEGFAKGDAELLGTVYASGLQAQRNIGRIDQLDTLLRSAPTGGLGAMKLAAGQFGINTEGLSDLQAAQAIINSLVPEQRQPGSGPMSDADLELFKQSLPRIINQPGGNAMIISTMKKIAQYDAQGAQIVQQLRAGEIDRATAFRLLMERQHPLDGVPLGGAAPGPQAPTGLSSEDLEFLGD